VLGLALLVLAVITLLSLLSITSGAVSDSWAALLRQLFGWGAIPAVLGVGWLGILLLWGSLRDETHPLLRWDVIIGVELVFVAGLSLLHLLVGRDDGLAIAQAGEGGGIVGWAISTLLANVVGRLGAGVILALRFVAGVGLMMGLSSAAPPSWIPSARGVQGAQDPSGEEMSDSRGLSRLAGGMAAWLRGLGQMEDELVAEEEPAPKRKASRRRKSKVRPEIEELPLRSQADESPGQATHRGPELPPLDLLVPSSKNPSAQS